MNPRANPFSTNRWIPGVFPYEFSPDGDGNAARLLDAVTKIGGIAQFVGPHGSGKSTLLETLARTATARGLDVRRALLNERNRRLPGDFRPGPDTTGTLFLLDGYEQLSLPARLRLRFRPWNRSAGLLWTAHRPALGIPVLHRTEARFEVFESLVRTLLADTPIEPEPRLFQELFEKTNGNFRDAFFELYDIAEDKLSSRDAL